VTGSSTSRVMPENLDVRLMIILQTIIDAQKVKGQLN
jgi:hypothetical protein